MEEFKAQLKELKIKLKTAEKRAIIAEKTVKVFAKEMDKREGKDRIYIYVFICIFLNSVFLNLTRRNLSLLINYVERFRLSVKRKGKIQVYLR